MWRRSRRPSRSARSTQVGACPARQKPVERHQVLRNEQSSVRHAAKCRRHRPRHGSDASVRCRNLCHRQRDLPRSALAVHGESGEPVRSPEAGRLLGGEFSSPSSAKSVAVATPLDCISDGHSREAGVLSRSVMCTTILRTFNSAQRRPVRKEAPRQRRSSSSRRRQAHAQGIEVVLRPGSTQPQMVKSISARVAVWAGVEPGSRRPRQLAIFATARRTGGRRRVRRVVGITAGIRHADRTTRRRPRHLDDSRIRSRPGVSKDQYWSNVVVDSPLKFSPRGRLRLTPSGGWHRRTGWR